MKSKKLTLLVLTAGLSVLSSIPAFASGWQKDTVGWWYGTNENNTTWYNSGWQWVDGNNDGIAESYYFNSNGYIAVNTIVDGYTVNGDGAWTVNGVVQTKQVSLNGGSTEGTETKEKTGSALFEEITEIGGSTGEKINLNGGGQTSSGDSQYYDGMPATGDAVLCDTNGDGVLTGREYESYVRMKSIKQNWGTGRGTIN